MHTHIINGEIRVKPHEGKIPHKEVILKDQKGAVIEGVVLFENRRPVRGAIAVLNSIDKHSGKITPISFMFTDENGMFVFGVKDLNCDYLVNVVYNEIF